MSEPILHQYAGSPFSEKIRLILGFKQLSWRAVEIPMYNPKPDAEALTGGYRRTPFLQIGCDIYCDTRLIARVLDELAPEPPLVPAGREAEVNMLAQFADQTLFPAATPYAFQPEAMARMAVDFPQDQAVAFMQDRAELAKAARVRPVGRLAFEFMPVYLADLEAQLSRGKYLVGDAATLADFATYHGLWFMRRARPELFEPLPGVVAWMDRLAALGHGTRSDLDAAAAIDECREASPRPRGESLPATGNDVAVGTQVQVMPADYAMDPTTGELCHVALDEVAVKRQDPRAGEVIVHFPRIGFMVKPV